jgi:hypothetical protein
MMLDSTGIGDLEQVVGRAVAELERLRGDNRRLREELEALRSQSQDGAEVAWAAEREALRGRVASLVETLEGLLAAGDAGGV